MEIKALRDVLFVKPDIERHEIFKLIRAKKTGTGVIIYAGNDCKDVKIGNRIAFGDFVGMDVNLEGVDYLVMREEHIMGVFDEE